jgi:hypothetical protein
MKHGYIRIRMDPSDYSDLQQAHYDWARTVYGNVKEEAPRDAPKPLGKPVIPTSYVDANLYHDMITGRSVGVTRKYRHLHFDPSYSGRVTINFCRNKPSLGANEGWGKLNDLRLCFAGELRSLPPGSLVALLRLTPEQSSCKLEHSIRYNNNKLWLLFRQSLYLLSRTA